jgi:hypothetical protein
VVAGREQVFGRWAEVFSEDEAADEEEMRKRHEVLNEITLGATELLHNYVKTPLETACVFYIHGIPSASQSLTHGTPIGVGYTRRSRTSKYTRDRQRICRTQSTRAFGGLRIENHFRLNLWLRFAFNTPRRDSLQILIA